MYWYRAKSILICLFACVNIFLVVTLFKSDQSTAYLSQKSINELITVLQSNGILMESKLLDKSFQYIKKIELTEYKVDINKELALKNKLISEKNAEKTAVKILRSQGINMDYARLDSINNKGDDIFLSFVSEVNSTLIFNSKIDVNLNIYGSYIKAEGTWLLPSDESVRGGINAKHGTPITSAVVSFAKDKTRADSSSTITDLSLGYDSMGEPVWQIKTHDGKEYFYK